MSNDNDEKISDEDPPWLQPVGDEGKPEPENEDARPRFSRLLIALFSVLVIALFATLIWFVYVRGAEVGEPSIVKAPDGPVKVEPEDRGGLDVPHQDKLVFNKVSGEEVPSESQLRPAAEEPLDRPSVPELVPEERLSAQTEVVGEVGDEGKEDVARADNDRISSAAGDADAAQSSSTRAASSDGSNDKNGALPADAWAVQIAAFRSKLDAAAWLAKTKFDHLEIFEGLESEVVKAERDLGVYYRVRFGSFKDRAAALAKCEEIKKIELNCIVVPPR